MTNDSSTLRLIASLAVRAVHVALVAFVLLAPFSNNPAVLRLHSVAVPSIVFHWMLNSDACCLTLLENKLRGVPVTDTGGFVHGIVAPVYNVHRTDIAALTWTVALLTWVATVVRIPGSSDAPSDESPPLRRTPAPTLAAE